MSIDGYFLIIKISVEKEMGIINAAIFPTICPGDKEFPTIKIIPEIAKIIEANVILDSLNWKKKIKNPQNYLKKKLKIISKIHQFKRRKLNIYFNLLN